VVLACTAFFAITGSASAVSVTCGGSLKLDKNGFAGPHGVDYAVKCDEDINGLSIAVSRRIDYFTPDPVAFDQSGNASSDDTFSCEGPFPGPGFGCIGHMLAGHTLKGQFSTVTVPCNPGVRAWLTVLTIQLKADGTPYQAVSHPFLLPPPKGCTTTTSARSAHRKHHRAHLRRRALRHRS
jgi:hypothetical protein